VFKLRQGFVKSRLTTEAEASAEQIPRLLQLRPNAVLVGGQALAVWANALNIVPTGPLDPYVTSDVDFLGSRSVAKELAEKLHVDLLVPSADDHVQVNSAILVLKDKRGSPVLVDFLNEIAGLEAANVRKRALEVEAFGTVFQVMHPVDCLESRICNLHLLPSKQNEIGLAQARLSIKIVHAFIRKVAASGEERHALKLTEHVGRLARSRPAAQVSGRYDINILDAIPVDILPAEFRDKQWPRLVARAEKKAKPYHNKTFAPSVASPRRIRTRATAAKGR